MLHRAILSGAVALTLSLTAVTGVDADTSSSADSWPSFRGEQARGLAHGQNLPTAWHVATADQPAKNIRWRTEIPGLGHSSPIVWGNRLYVTTATTKGLDELRLGDDGGIDMAADDKPHTWMLLSIDAKTGDEVWRREVTSGVPRAKRHVKASQANSSPATDGKVIAAIFGSEGLFVYDLDGEKLWSQDLGILDPGFAGRGDSQWGYASSTLVVDGKVVVQVDRHEASYVAAYDAGSGKQLWKVDREERPVWATPTFYDGHGREELIVIGGFYNRGYDLDTGKELWRFADDAAVKTPTPFVAGDRVIFGGGYRARPVFAVKAGQSGDLSEPEPPAETDEATDEKAASESGAKATADAQAEAAEAEAAETQATQSKDTSGLVWRTEPGGPYTTTPIAHGDLLYSVTDVGILNVYDFDTGERLERIRTDEHFSASPVATHDKIYFASEGGQVLVLRPGKKLEVLARNDMGEALMATPAIAHDTLYVRSTRALYAIAEDAPSP